MTLRRSILLFTGGMVLAMSLIASTFMWQMMAGAISGMEEAYVHQKVDATLFYLQEDLSSLKRVGGDWGLWNDTRDFVIGKSEMYIQSNLDNWTLSNLGVDFMIFYDGSGDLFYSRAFDPTTGAVVSAPHRLLNLARDDPLLAHSSPEDASTGIIADPEGLLVVSSHPITDSQGLCPISGTLIVGSRLDEAKLDELGRMSGLVLRMEPLAPAREKTNSASPDALLIERVDEETIVASRVVEDVYGNPTILLEARIPREIH